MAFIQLALIIIRGTCLLPYVGQGEDGSQVWVVTGVGTGRIILTWHPPDTPDQATAGFQLYSTQQQHIYEPKQNKKLSSVHYVQLQVPSICLTIFVQKVSVFTLRCCYQSRSEG